MIRKFTLPALAVGMLAISIYHLLFAAERIPEYPPAISPPTSDFVSKIAASGLLEAGSENMALGTAISGVVTQVFVRSANAGETVAAGTPLFQVDDRHLQAQLKVQMAAVDVAQAQLARLEKMPRAEEIPISEAKVRAAEAALKQAEDQSERLERLVNTEAVSASSIVSAQAGSERARQELLRAQAEDALLRAGAWEEDKRVALANLEAAKAGVEQTKTEIDRCVVKAPVAGVILKVDVRPGEQVMAESSQPLVVLGDMTTKHIRVSIDEQDAGRFATDAAAIAVPRGNTRVRIPLRFVRVEPLMVPKRSFTGDNTERLDTRVLEVIYAIESEPTPVYVGQQFDIFIAVSSPLQTTDALSAR